MIIVRQAETFEDLQGILTLQRKNLKDNLSPYQRKKEGFVTVQHDLETLEKMNAYEKQIIAVDDDLVVGYALVLVKELGEQVPLLRPLQRALERVSFQSKAISDHSYYIMGQVCIDVAYRGKGIFPSLYEGHRKYLGTAFDICVTSISKSNTRSLHAHLKVGFDIVHSFEDDTDRWDIVLINWKSDK